MKKVFSILLIFVLSAGFVVNLGIYAWFQLEQSYIASTLCENRYVPESDCGGHCVLEKKINDVEQKSAVIIVFKLLSFVCAEAQADFVYPALAETPEGHLAKTFDYRFVSKIFKPPIV